METSIPVEATLIPKTTVPRYSFLFLMEGEILADIDGHPFLCQAGQFLLVPEGMTISVNYFKDLVGYTGSFQLSALRDVSYSIITSGQPVIRTFWFDGATFVAQVMDRLTAALARGDEGYITRAFDLILYMMKSPTEVKSHPLVIRFFEMLFDRSQVLDSVSGYAERLGISPSYLNKLVRTQTRHSAMDWVEISRVNWAKSLLKEGILSISDVSLAIGVDDPSYFTRFFRKSTGMTPSEYRRSAMKKVGKL
ncbi:MAG: helix-turn-helix domain-containing protein [Bacteroidales bacterium]|nr:helix-turn-helix domain-containing protein [Bacteroidales bacterium]